MKPLSGALVLLLAAAPALAQSNIGLTAYPTPKCDKPAPLDPGLRPAPPPENPTEAQAGIYNSKTRAYNNAVRTRNAQLQDFAACMKAYVEASNADVKRIQQAVDAAVANANTD